MIQRSMIALSLILLVSVESVSKAEALGRPGLALKFDVDGQNAKLIVAFDYLPHASDQPRFEGVRRYTYDIAIGGGPVRVGWNKGENEVAVLVERVKYIYAPEPMDRHENGSISITTQDASAGTYRIRGVYYYSDQLFVMDAVVKAGDPILLYEASQ